MTKANKTIFIAYTTNAEDLGTDNDKVNVICTGDTMKEVVNDLEGHHACIYQAEITPSDEIVNKQLVEVV